MKKLFMILGILATTHLQAQKVADSASYLAHIKQELVTQWPKNRTINLVFHGHSVPAGFWHNHEVHTLESYPHLVLEKLKEKYPYAVINVIVTAIGGENSLKGQKRFETEVLPHKPDVLMIDYALNDRFSDLGLVKEAWEKMVKAALEKGIKVILLTPSPDQRIDISTRDNPLQPHVEHIRNLAAKYEIGLADPYLPFQNIVRQGDLKAYMSHVNHPNKQGHEVIAKEIFKWFD
ncbi:SGNH/GDSL hydrolase family protein [Runella sp. MFBS21]|uniref:SGNH/GDSL hydrolase family protein n=1 Tax=Runella sp. MFBS21 TaxID=3034018 RepID=UPI0023F8AE3E|nr:SGNH/GDSL hydrolase family protein [Runella sp. MFBS21]MDF7817165.1 SGNH/GDSL hydrolase family protein [Runella sp. MFBS21]